MFYWVGLLIVLAIVDGVFAFGHVIPAGVGAAQVLFAIFVFLLIVSLIFGALRGRRTY